jgi:hypothetical protein
LLTALSGITGHDSLPSCSGGSLRLSVIATPWGLLGGDEMIVRLSVRSRLKTQYANGLRGGRYRQKPAALNRRKLTTSRTPSTSRLSHLPSLGRHIGASRLTGAQAPRRAPAHSPRAPTCPSGRLNISCGSVGPHRGTSQGKTSCSLARPVQPP